jgi:hypothetical protein
MPEVQNITQSFDINVGRRIRIKEDCISRDEFIGKTGRVLEAVPHIRIQLEEPIDYGNGTFGVRLRIYRRGNRVGGIVCQTKKE